MTNFISKILAVLLIAFTAFLPAKPDGVEITVKDVTTISTGISYVCKNNTNRRISRPSVEKLEKNVDGNWEEIQVCFFVTEEFYYIYPGQRSTDGGGFCGAQQLREGEYRLTIVYSMLNSLKGELEQGRSSVEFAVTKA